MRKIDTILNFYIMKNNSNSKKQYNGLGGLKLTCNGTDSTCLDSYKTSNSLH